MVNPYDCIALKFGDLSKKIRAIQTHDIHDLIIINGVSLCGTCPAGEFLYNINSKRENIVYFVPEFYTTNDYENLRYAFDIKGKIVKTDMEIDNLLKRISACKRLDEIRKNVYLELGKNRKVKQIYVF